MEYLEIKDITKEAVESIRPDVLFRTHVALHKMQSDNFAKVLEAHEIVKTELKERGLLHSHWDNLDEVY